MVIMEAVNCILDFVMNVLKSKLLSVYNYLYELSVTLLTQMTVLTYLEKSIESNSLHGTFFTALFQALYDFFFFSG